jgi:hypothetical protein
MVCHAQTDLDNLLAEVKTIELPFTDSIRVGSNSELNDIEINDWDNLGLDSLEKYNKDFKYFILGYWDYKNTRLLLIERAYIEENIHWLCIINENKITDWLMTAYDNSEGFLNIYSHIDTDMLTIKTCNDFAENKQTIKYYQIQLKGFSLNPRPQTKTISKIDYLKNDTTYFDKIDSVKQDLIDLDFLVMQIGYPPRIPQDFYWHIPDTSKISDIEKNQLFYKYRFDETGRVTLWYYLGSYISGIFPREYLFYYDSVGHINKISDLFEKEEFYINYDNKNSISSIERKTISGELIEKLIIK